MRKKNGGILNLNCYPGVSAFLTGFVLIVVFIITVSLPARTLARTVAPQSSQSSTDTQQNNAKGIQGVMLQGGDMQGDTSRLDGTISSDQAGDPSGCRPSDSDKARAQASDQSGEVPPYLFRIGSIVTKLLDPSPAPRFIYACHPNIDLTLVDKSDPDYPLLASKDTRESGHGHEEDIIKFQGFVGDPNGPLTPMVKNMPIDPAGKFLPPFIPQQGKTVQVRS